MKPCMMPIETTNKRYHLFRTTVRMKAAAWFLFALTALSFQGFCAEKKDPVEQAFRDAWDYYKDGDEDNTLKALYDIIDRLEAKNQKRVENILPEEVGDWKGQDLKRDDLSGVGGGQSLSRVYGQEKERITVKIVKDSPLIKGVISLLANEQLLALSKRKTYQINGETAVMEGDSKLQMVVDKRIYLELVASEDADEIDLRSFARKLDTRKLGKIR